MSYTQSAFESISLWFIFLACPALLYCGTFLLSAYSLCPSLHPLFFSRLNRSQPPSLEHHLSIEWFIFASFQSSSLSFWALSLWSWYLIAFYGALPIFSLIWATFSVRLLTCTSFWNRCVQVRSRVIFCYHVPPLDLLWIERTTHFSPALLNLCHASVRYILIGFLDFFFYENQVRGVIVWWAHGLSCHQPLPEETSSQSSIRRPLYETSPWVQLLLFQIRGAEYQVEFWQHQAGVSPRNIIHRVCQPRTAFGQVQLGVCFPCLSRSSCAKCQHLWVVTSYLPLYLFLVTFIQLRASCH